MEKRLLLAFVLSAAILFAWSVIFPPPQRTQAPPEPAVMDDPVDTTAVEERETAPAAEEAEEAQPAVATDEVITAAVEEEIELKNAEVSVTLTNRGAAVSSYLLVNHDNDEGFPVNLVQAVTIPDRSLPLQLVTPNGPDDGVTANTVLPGEARITRDRFIGGIPALQNVVPHCMRHTQGPRFAPAENAGFVRLLCHCRHPTQ